MPERMTVDMKIKIAGVIFSCEAVGDITDSFERNIVEHKIIGYNGAKLEDTGLNAKKLSIETVWRNLNYYSHEKFLKAYIKNKSECVLTHPVYGDIVGSINSATVSNAYNEIDCAHISINFTEYGEPQMQRGHSFVYGSVAAKAAGVVNEMKTAVSTRTLGKFLNKINSMKSVIGQVSSRINMATAIANTVVDAALFPATIPGMFAEMAVRAVESANDIKEKILQSPAASMSKIRNAMLALCRNLEEFFEPSGGRVMADLIKSYTLFNECLIIAQVCDAAAANPERILFEDIESCVNGMRNFAKEIIAADRPQTTALAEAVNEITNAAKSTLSALNNERRVRITQETAIYNVLVMNRIHRSKAERICRRNWIDNPNKIRGEIIIPQADY